MTDLRSPFPYFGGKSQIADAVWERFGTLDNYVEPFFGSGAVLLNRPQVQGIETVNDLDGFISNFWRAVRSDPEAVAFYADWPVNENDLHARHAWLVRQKESLQTKLEGDPDFFDSKVAGWWCWGMCCWIGGGFCSGEGPWQQIDGQLVHLGNAGKGVNRQLVHLGNAGQGVNRQLVHLGNAGKGVNRQLVHLGNAGKGVNRKRVDGLYDWMEALAERLRFVRVCCGDWSRVCGPMPTLKNGLTGIFLDPPYSEKAGRVERCYNHDSLSVAHDVREWCLANGENPRLRIALCGYEGEHDLPGWECLSWKAHGGYASQRVNGENNNAFKERIWFSPACLKVELDLFSRTRTNSNLSSPGAKTL